MFTNQYQYNNSTFAILCQPANSGVADLEDDFERETEGFTLKIIALLSNAQMPTGCTKRGHRHQLQQNQS
jgi:hypothetical protein